MFHVKGLSRAGNLRRILWMGMGCSKAYFIKAIYLFIYLAKSLPSQCPGQTHTLSFGPCLD